MFSPTIAQRGLASPFEGHIQTAAGGDWSLYLLIKSVISTESAWNPTAVRLEPRVQDASYGLMQILLGTAKWLGYPGDGNGLYDPGTNIKYGSRYLVYQLDRYPGVLSDAISAYNGGHALRASGGGYVNQRYVDEVNIYYVWYQNNHPAPVAPVPPDGPPPDVAPPPPILTVDPGTGTVTDTATGNPIISALDTVTGIPVDLEQVSIDTATGSAFVIETGNPVQLEMFNGTTTVPFFPSRPVSAMEPVGAVALLAGLAVLTLAGGRA